MSEFPSLVPSAAPITPGSWAAGSHQALSGGRSIVRVSSAETGRRLRLTFENITEEHFLWIRNHYRGHRSGFDSFGFNTTTLAAALTPSGYSWRWAAPPQVTDRHADVFSVSCEFLAVPRSITRAVGRAWQSGASTLTRGAWTAFRNFGAGVSWATSSTTLIKGEKDQYISDVAVLLHFDGADSSTTITDSSPNNLTITLNGDAQLKTAQKRFGSASLYLDGTGDYIQTATTSLMNVAGVAFTCEMWFRPDSNSTYDKGIFSLGDGSSTVPFALDQVNRKIAFLIGNASLSGWQEAPETANNVLTAGTWSHLAVVGTTTTITLFVDGISVISTTRPAWASTNRALFIGKRSAVGVGYFDEARFTLNRARYSTNFAPSDQAFSDV